MDILIINKCLKKISLILLAYAPIQTHFEIIKACIDAGVKSIFCEKTISYSLKEIDEIILLCKANNTPNERMVDAILIYY